MNSILRKLALSMLTAQLNNPATRQSLHDYVDAQVRGFVDREAAKFDTANPFGHVLATTLKSEEVRTLLDGVVNEEFDALLKVALDRLTAAA